MPDEHDIRQRELLRAVWDDYDSDAPRLAYAGWLDTIDDPAESARAEAIRLSLQLAQPPTTRRPAESARLNELQRKYATAWMAGLPTELATNRPVMVRGMFESSANVNPPRLLADGDRWFRKAPPDFAFTLSFRGTWPKKAAQQPMNWPALLGKPWWERIIGLEPGGYGLDICRQPITNPAFRRLRHLNFAYSRIRDEGALVLAASPVFAELRRLNLNNSGLTKSGVLALVKREIMPKLKTLQLMGTRLTPSEWDEVRAAVPRETKVRVDARWASVTFDPEPSDPDDSIPC